MSDPSPSLMMSIPAFAAAHGVSKSLLYRLLAEGRGRRIAKIGRRTLITPEAPTSRHTPGSAPGCVLFVKLWQFDLKDRTEVRRDAPALAYMPVEGRPGVETAALFQDGREDVRMERWQPNASLILDLPGGGEFLVLDGAFDEGGESFAPQSWLRLPPQGRLSATAGVNGCTLWVKSGHLRHIQNPPARN
jgi:hypothetical protein